MNDSSLTVAAMPLDIADGDPQLNIQKIYDNMPLLPDGTDLIVLPELFSTGYIGDAARAAQLAEPVDGYTMTEIKRLASTYNVAICGSFLAKEVEKMYNRGFFVEPSGETAYYDKHHLFCLSAESEIVAKGTLAPWVVRYRGWNISMAICYDVRFGVWMRNVDNAYDVMLVPANWPDKRSYAWQHLLIARAIENQAYVVGCNRSGKDEYGEYGGLTYIYDYMGNAIGEPLEGSEIVVAKFAKQQIIKIREHFPVWKDADRFEIQS